MAPLVHLSAGRLAAADVAERSFANNLEKRLSTTVSADKRAAKSLTQRLLLTTVFSFWCVVPTHHRR
jgi:hypothetical protein